MLEVFRAFFLALWIVRRGVLPVFTSDGDFFGFPGDLAFERARLVGLASREAENRNHQKRRGDPTGFEVPAPICRQMRHAQSVGAGVADVLHARHFQMSGFFRHAGFTLCLFLCAAFFLFVGEVTGDTYFVPHVLGQFD